MGTARRRGIILWTVMVLGMSVPAVKAADRLVPSQYGTIQAAIDACVDGDVVIVAARDPNNPYTGQGFRDLDFSHNLPAG